VAAAVPWLLEVRGVGPISAAQPLVSWSHPRRFRLRGCVRRAGWHNPIPASFGQVTRHRLDRGGDRQLNCALHTVVLVRLRDDPETKAYAARRTAEGKSLRDVKRPCSCPPGNASHDQPRLSRTNSLARILEQPSPTQASPVAEASIPLLPSHWAAAAVVR
jgi:hypothetical protein